MTKTICGFNVQTKIGVSCGWTVPISFAHIPIGNEIEIMTNEVDKLADEHTVLECYAIYSMQGTEIYKSEQCTKEDVEEIIDVLFKVSK